MENPDIKSHGKSWIISWIVYIHIEDMGMDGMMYVLVVSWKKEDEECKILHDRIYIKLKQYKKRELKKEDDL